jgi:hypothetical protein
MIEFLNLTLMGGLVAVAAPIIIHLLHRRKVKRLDWGAMRFLLELLARNRRRLLLEELLLLLVRVLLVALLGLALTRPALKRTRLFGADGVARYGRTAAVLLIDDSLSSASGRTQMALDEIKRLAAAYLNTLAPGDEVSILLQSQRGGLPADPLFDLEAVRAMVSQVQPSAVASDVPALLEAGMAQLSRHVNPGAELVLISDGRRDGWRPTDRARWDETRQRLRGARDATQGSRQRPHVLVLSPAVTSAEGNLALIDLRLDRTLVSARRPAGLRAQLTWSGRPPPPQGRVRFLVNGRVIGGKAFSLAGPGQQEVGLTHTFEEPGSYVVQAQLEGTHDSLPLDDQRCLAVQVESSVPVLLVEGRPAPGLQSSLGFLAAALDPEGQGRGPFELTRISPAQLNEQRLQNQRVVVLGDLSALTSEVVAALERHVVSGGGILVGLGAQTDAALINRVWARAGSGFLPAPLLEALSPAQPLTIGQVSQGHPVFNAFGSRSMEVWKEARIRRHYRLDFGQALAGEIDRLLTLENGEALLAERRRGAGLVALLTTSLDGQWNDLPLLPAYVPLMRGVVGHLGSFVSPPRNLAPGDRLTFTALRTNQHVIAEGPSGRPFPLTPGVWEGRQALVSDPLQEPGAYVLRQGSQVVRYAVATAPEESELTPVSDPTRQACLGEVAYQLFQDPEQIQQALGAAKRRSVELWRWCLGSCLGLMFLETFITRREAKKS